MTRDVQIIIQGDPKTVRVKTSKALINNRRNVLSGVKGTHVNGTARSGVYAIPPSNDKMHEIRSFMREVISNKHR